MAIHVIIKEQLHFFFFFISIIIIQIRSLIKSIEYTIMSFTPAFDAYLLRQLANAFPLLAMWARKHVSLKDYPLSIQNKDKILTKKDCKVGK